MRCGAFLLGVPSGQPMIGRSRGCSRGRSRSRRFCWCCTCRRILGFGFCCWLPAVVLLYSATATAAAGFCSAAPIGFCSATAIGFCSAFVVVGGCLLSATIAATAERGNSEEDRCSYQKKPSLHSAG